MSTALKPPFSLESAREKVQRAEDLWNTRNPQNIALAYTANSQWRNRSEFIQGREEIASLLDRKWTRELDYKLKKELFTYAGHRIAAHFEYEYHDHSGQWFRAHGNENWEFDDDGLMHTRDASINEHTIDESQRTLF